MSNSPTTTLTSELDAYDAAVRALADAIVDCGQALKEQDGDRLPVAIEAQQQCAEQLQRTQRHLTEISAARGFGSLKEAVNEDAAAATLQPRYRQIKTDLQQIQHALVTQAEAVSRAMANNAELIALLTNAQPTGDYEADGQTGSTAQNTLSARA